LATITVNIDRHERTLNLYPWTNLVVPLIKERTDTNLILTQFRLHPCPTMRRHYLCGTIPHRHLRRSVIIRPWRRLSRCTPTGSRLWTRGDKRTTTTGRGAASVLLCDLAGTYCCVFSSGYEISQQLQFFVFYPGLFFDMTHHFAVSLIP
jgi:hypothetical protein